MKNVLRFAPCPDYDVERLESWLTDMAAEGLHLKAVNALDLFVFCKGEPKNVRCRLEAAQAKHTLFSRNPRPSKNMLELTQEYGWDFVTRCGDYFIFRSETADAPELNTDSTIQALTLRALKKRWLSGLLYILVYLAVFLFVLAPGFFYHMAAYGSLLLMGLVLALLLLFIGQLAAFCYVFRLYRKLTAGSLPDHRKDWRRRAQLHHLRHICSLCLLVLVLLGWVQNLAADIRHPLAEYPGTPAFVTLEELTPENTEITLDKIDNGYYQDRPDLLFPANLQWLDGGQVTYPDGSWTAGILEIHFCEAAAPWLARAVARDYLDLYHFRYEADAVPIPDLNLDYATAYYDEYGLGHFVLAEGSTVVCGRFSMSDQYGHFSSEAWIQAMAQRLTTDGGV